MSDDPAKDDPANDPVSGEPMSSDDSGGERWVLPFDSDGWHEPASSGEPYAESTPPQRRAPGDLWRSRVLAGAALVAVGAAAGVGIGRAAWGGGSGRTLTPAANGFSGPGGSSGGGTGGLPGGSGGFPGGFPGGGFPGGGVGGGPGGTTGSNASGGPADAAAIARHVDPGVVDITTVVPGGEAAGTGMVLTSDGEVLTNNHVIDGATNISVRDVGNGQTYKADVVGYDRSHDVAVIQLVGASGLTTVHPASGEPGVGAAVVGIGNAGGTGGTPSYAGGAITGTDVAITAHDEYDGTSERLTGLLGTNADIQAGDSGGPLVNASGDVVGMDTAASSGYRFSPFGSDSTSSTAFAIPIVTALQIAGQIEAGQASSTVHVGPTAKLGAYVSTRPSAVNGAEVVRTQPGDPAAKAGIGSGDVITAVDGKTVTNADDLSNVMTQLSPGQTVTIDYTTSQGERRTARVTLVSGAPQ